MLRYVSGAAAVGNNAKRMGNFCFEGAQHPKKENSISEPSVMISEDSICAQQLPREAYGDETTSTVEGKRVSCAIPKQETTMIKQKQQMSTQGTFIGGLSINY